MEDTIKGRLMEYQREFGKDGADLLAHINMVTGMGMREREFADLVTFGDVPERLEELLERFLNTVGY
jgi:hypothetical protein